MSRAGARLGRRTQHVAVDGVTTRLTSEIVKGDAWGKRGAMLEEVLPEIHLPVIHRRIHAHTATQG